MQNPTLNLKDEKPSGFYLAFTLAGEYIGLRFNCFGCQTEVGWQPIPRTKPLTVKHCGREDTCAAEMFGDLPQLNPAHIADIMRDRTITANYMREFAARERALAAQPPRIVSAIKTVVIG
jgi:hypothetical protein